MNKYNKPELEIIEIQTTDVITTSGLVATASEFFTGTLEWSEPPSITE